MNNSFIRRVLFGILIGIAVLTLLSGCTTKTSDQVAEKHTLRVLRATKKYTEKNISIGDNFFSSKHATVHVGTIVIWTNKGQSIHDVMWDKSGTSKAMKDFTSDTLRTGDIHVALFDKPGKYFYHCHFHGGPQRGQWGVIVVKS